MTGAAARAAGVALDRLARGAWCGAWSWIAPASGGTETPPGVARAFDDRPEFRGSRGGIHRAGRIRPGYHPSDTTGQRPMTPARYDLHAGHRDPRGTALSCPPAPISAASPIAATPATARATDVATAPVTDTVNRARRAGCRASTRRKTRRVRWPATVTNRRLSRRPPRHTVPTGHGGGRRESREPPRAPPEGSQTQRQGDTDAAPGPTAREIARYPQQVNRHLSRLRRPASGHREPPSSRSAISRRWRACLHLGLRNPRAMPVLRRTRLAPCSLRRPVPGAARRGADPLFGVGARALRPAAASRGLSFRAAPSYQDS
jgi:hypothetical protein